MEPFLAHLHPVDALRRQVRVDGGELVTDGVVVRDLLDGCPQIISAVNTLVLKYCTGSSARSYQCKFGIDSAFKNKKVESLEEIGPALKKIIHFKTIRGKFSSVHPDLAAEGITRVEVGEEGLHFIRSTTASKSLSHTQACFHEFFFSKRDYPEGNI